MWYIKLTWIGSKNLCVIFQILYIYSLYMNAPAKKKRGLFCFNFFISCENSKITTHCWTIINRRNVGSHQKRYPHPRAKKKSQQDGRRDKISFRIKPHTCQRCLEGSNQTLCVPGPRDPTETEPNLCLTLQQRYRPAVACNRDRSSGYNYLGHSACCIRPLGGGHH